jgi:hypothetical protein
MPDWMNEALKFMVLAATAGLSAWAGFNSYTKRMASLTASTIIAAVDQSSRMSEIERRVASVERDHDENTERIVKTLEALTERIDRLFELVVTKEHRL